MKALVRNTGNLSVRSMPLPTIKSDHDVMISVALAGLCRTDLYVAEGRLGNCESLILGHEFSGTVLAVGDKVEGVRSGQRIAVNPLFSCRQCGQCVGGSPHSCQDSDFLGIDRDGCFAELVVVPRHAVYAVPDGVTHFQTAYAEPVAASLAVFKAGISPADKGLILGNNRFSQLLQRIFALRGFANVTICGADEEPAELYDFVVETVHGTGTIDKMVRAVKPGGKLILKTRHFEPTSFNLLGAIKKEPVIHIVNYGGFEEALALLASGELNVDDLIDDVYPLEKYAGVFERAARTEALKPFFICGEV